MYMRNVNIISLSLPREDIDFLDQMAKVEGSRSSAVRKLLKLKRREEMEEAYRAYYSDTANVEADRKLTEEMNSIASWPDDYPDLRGGHGRKKRTAR